MVYTLYIKPDPAVKDLYTTSADAYNSTPRAERDAGFDLFSVASSAHPEGVTKITQQTVAALYDGLDGGFRAYFMMPRSSISKTPLRLANSIGLIDAGYRGPLLAVVDNISENTYNVAANTRLFQIVSPDLRAFHRVLIVDEIPGGPTLRGEGGFGSTGL